LLILYFIDGSRSLNRSWILKL